MRRQIVCIYCEKEFFATDYTVEPICSFAFSREPFNLALSVHFLPTCFVRILSTEMKMNPIDTAPKDRHILLCFSNPKGPNVWIQGFYEKSYGDSNPAEDWKVLALPAHGCGCCSETNPMPIGWLDLP